MPRISQHTTPKYRKHKASGQAIVTLALVDKESGKVASAKNPRRWPNLFDFQASFLADISTRSEIPPARITFPNGEILVTDHPDIEARLSAAVGREVRLAQQTLEGAKAEGYWPDHDK